MKKLLVICLIVSVINLILTAVIIRKDCRSVSLTNQDSVINKVRIDSIELIINKKDSVILKIKEYELKEIKQADSLNNDDAVVLFKKLVSE